MDFEFVEGLGHVLVRRTSSRRIKITFGKVGNIELRLPKRYSKKAAISYLKANRDWVLKHQPVENVIRENEYVLDVQIRREDSSEDTIRLHPAKMVLLAKAHQDIFYHPEFQIKMHRKLSSILRKSADDILKHRLKHLAIENDIIYKDVRTANSTSRWGSCNQDNEIMLSSYLIQLPQNLIDYVTLHELAHTRHHNHSKKYWNYVSELDNNYRSNRAHLRQFRPTIMTRPSPYTVQ